MNKINIQALTLGSKLNPMDSKDGDILGGLFSIPLIENDSKKIKEFIFPSNFFKSIKSGDSQNISNLLTDEKMYANLKNFSKENISELMTRQPEENKTKINLKNKSKKNHVSLKVDISNYLKLKKHINKKILPSNEVESGALKVNHLNKDIKTLLESKVNIAENNSKINLGENDKKKIHQSDSKHLKIIKNNEYSQSFKNDKPIEEKTLEGKNENFSHDEKFLSYGSIKDTPKSKFNHDNFSLNINSTPKMENTNINNQSSNGQNHFSNDKNMNFVLDNFIEQLDMAEKGWTEKLAMRVGKALSDGSEEIELFLKPKELGSLKINLKVSKNHANIVFKAENNHAIHALQQSENLLTKCFVEQGMNIEKTHYENLGSNMNNNQNNNSNSKENKDSNKSDAKLNENKGKIEQNIENNNSNYIINIKV